MLDEPQTFEQFEAETKAITEPFRSSFNVRWAHEARAAKPVRNWQIKDLILAGSFGIVFGPPGCGKSFLVSDMCLTMSAGILNDDDARPTWFGYKGRPFGVVYVVAEGSDDFEIRLHAWMEQNEIGEDVVIPFVYLPTSVDLRSSDAHAKKLVAEIKAISEEMKRRCGVEVEMVVIDTVARALSGGNENASEVMSAFVNNCGLIQEQCSTTVLGVHHGSKDGTTGPRGHGGLHGAVDFEFEVIGATKDEPNAWTVRKLKAGPGGATHRFRLRQERVGEDDDGDPITSCVVVPARPGDPGTKEKSKGWKINPTEREFLDVLAHVIDRNGVMPPPDGKLPSKVVLVATVDAVKTEFMSRYSATVDGDEDQVKAKLAARWERATKSLLRYGLIGSRKPYLWFSGKAIRDFKIRGVQTGETASPTHVQALPADDAAERVDLSAL
mgnify:CR=1 FL=1